MLTCLQDLVYGLLPTFKRAGERCCTQGTASASKCMQLPAITARNLTLMSPSAHCPHLPHWFIPRRYQPIKQTPQHALVWWWPFGPPMCSMSPTALVCTPGSLITYQSTNQTNYIPHTWGEGQAAHWLVIPLQAAFVQHPSRCSLLHHQLIANILLPH
jgi:hypothetical protein